MVRLIVKTTGGKSAELDIELSRTVKDCKTVLSEQIDVPVELQRLIHKGKVLKDAETLDSYGIRDNDTIFFVKGSARASQKTERNSSSTSTSVSSTNASNGDTAPSSAANTANASSQLPPPFPFGVGNQGLAGLGNMFGMSDMQQMQQNLMQNPEMVRQMMDSPIFQSFMSNPDIIRSVVQSNPAIQRLMEENPQLNHLLNDPELLRQSMEAIRNPVAMREIMRSQDTALRNIESHPEGFNLLRRMYHDVQEPFLDAAASGLSTSRGPAFTMPGVTSTTPAVSSSSQPANSSSSVPLGSVPQMANPWANLGTTTQASSSSTEGNPVPNLGLLGSLGPGLGNVANSPQMNQIFESAMSHLINNPDQFIQQMEQASPPVAALLNLNPQLRQSMQNPEFMRSMLSLQNLQSMMQLQTAMSQLQGNTNLLGSNTSAASGSNNLYSAGHANPFDNLNSLLSGMPNSAGASMPSNPEQYASQLTQMNEMGFTNNDQNLRALQATSGNVHAAVDRILNGFL